MQGGKECKQFSEQYRRKSPSDTYRPNTVNLIYPADFTGPMETGFQKTYAWAMLDIHSGISIAAACVSPDAKAAIQT